MLNKLTLILKIFLCVFGYFKLSSFCEEKTDGFTIEGICSHLPSNPSWEIAPLSFEEQSKIEKILSQPFRYLGKGGQCYAFASEDGNYVLKFFKQRLSIPKRYILSQKRIDRLTGKLDRDFSSYKLAFEELKDETGLLYLHLTPTTNLKKVTLIDKLFISHSIDLDHRAFVLQKRGELVYPHLQRLMEEEKIEEAKQSIQELLTIVISRSKKGILDEDARLHRNFGFIQNKAIMIDCGRFKRCEERKSKKVYKQDLLKMIKPFKLWLDKKDPLLSSYLAEKLDEI